MEEKVYLNLLKLWFNFNPGATLKINAKWQVEIDIHGKITKYTSLDEFCTIFAKTLGIEVIE